MRATPPIKAKWRKHYEHLARLLEQLRRRRGFLNQDALQEAPNFSSHMADAATDTYDRDLALCLLSSQQDAVYEVEEALSRIRDGTYGVCELTGKPIESARLEAIPWTRFSTAAEKELERDGALKRPGLGPRETVARVGTIKPEDE